MRVFTSCQGPCSPRPYFAYSDDDDDDDYSGGTTNVNNTNSEQTWTIASDQSNQSKTSKDPAPTGTEMQRADLKRLPTRMCEPQRP